MKVVRATLSAFVILALAGCALTQVRTDYDRHVTFAQLRTYDWVDNSVGTNGDQPTISPLLERRIHNAVDSELASKGFQKVRSGAPDFRVAYRVVAEEKVRTDRSYGRSYGYSPFYGQHGFGHHGFLHRGFGHGHFGHHSFGQSDRVCARPRAFWTVSAHELCCSRNWFQVQVTWSRRLPPSQVCRPVLLRFTAPWVLPSGPQSGLAWAQCLTRPCCC